MTVPAWSVSYGTRLVQQAQERACSQCCKISTAAS